VLIQLIALEIVSLDIRYNEVVALRIICAVKTKLINDDNVKLVKKNEPNQMNLILDVFVILIKNVVEYN
jgi:hypothetical protein